MKQPIPFGKYLLLERINVGGMAEIFLARSRGLHGFKRILAIKKILPTMAEDKEFIAMFIDEARIAAELSHAGIVQIFELGKFEEDYYIAMEFIHGKDLRFIQERMSRDKTPTPITKAAYIANRICEALDYAHNRKDPTGRPLGIIHRDVSPQNVIISYEGEVKICDFGIAKAANRSQKTQAGVLKGKFGYMSPEQVRGLPLDGRSDIFTVGTLLYEMVTLERLFVGESDFSTLEKVRNADVVPPSTYNREVPEELEDIILKALAKEVEDRYQSTAEFGEALQAFMLNSEIGSARDLAVFMKQAFTAEYDAELRRLEKYQKLPESAFDAPPQEGERFEEGDEDSVHGDADLDAKTLIFASHEVEGEGAKSGPPPVPIGNRPGDRPDPSKPEIADAKTMIFGEPEEVPESGTSPKPELANANTMIFADPEIVPDGDIHELPTRGILERPDFTAQPATPKKVPVRKPSFSERAFFPLAVVAALLLGWSLFVTFQMIRQGPVEDESKFELVTQPATGLKVYLDGSEVATVTPFVASELSPGAHRVRVEGKGYLKYEREVQIKKGVHLVLEASLIPDATRKDSGKPDGIKPDPARVPGIKPGIGHSLDGGVKAGDSGSGEKIAKTIPKPKPTKLVVDSNPKGAMVSVAGRRIGPTPLRTTRVKAGKRVPVVVSLRGYRTVRRLLDIEKEQVNELRVELQKAAQSVRHPGPGKEPVKPAKVQYGYLVANTRPWSKVFIDGKYTGRETPIAPDKKLKLTVGKHQIVFETPGGKRYVFEVEIEVGKVLKLIKRLEG